VIYVNTIFFKEIGLTRFELKSNFVYRFNCKHPVFVYLVNYWMKNMQLICLAYYSVMIDVINGNMNILCCCSLLICQIILARSKVSESPCFYGLRVKLALVTSLNHSKAETSP